MLWPKPNSKNSGFFQLLLCSLYVFKEKTIIEFCASVHGIFPSWQDAWASNLPTVGKMSGFCWNDSDIIRIIWWPKVGIVRRVNVGRASAHSPAQWADVSPTANPDEFFWRLGLANKCEFDHLAKVIRRINCSHSLLNHELNWHYFSATCVLKAYGAGKMLWVNVVAPTRRRAKYPCAEFINVNKHVHEMYVLLTCISHQYYKLIKSVVIRTQLDENLRTGANYANFPGKSTSLKVNYWCKPLREINFKMACTWWHSLKVHTGSLV